MRILDLHGTVGRLGAILLAVLLACVPTAATAAPLPNDAALVEGFEAIVFGTEIPGLLGGGQYVKKFAKPVRFYIANEAARDRRTAVRAFVASLGRQIRGLSTAITGTARDADFVIHVVDRKDYQRVGREIYRNPFMSVPGNCIVRSDFGRRGIVRSDALIVSDEGEKLFRRCLIEEVLQGLGPLNDNQRAPDSVFNDTSSLASFSRYDRIMLNMLYDARLTPGMSLGAARPLLPEIARSARRATR